MLNVTPSPQVDPRSEDEILGLVSFKPIEIGWGMRDLHLPGPRSFHRLHFHDSPTVNVLKMCLGQLFVIILLNLINKIIENNILRMTCYVCYNSEDDVIKSFRDKETEKIYRWIQITKTGSIHSTCGVSKAKNAQ